ncbi:MAG: transposase [Methylococcales bacterium]|nr:transposase [Methylococcales bacterium]
MVYLFLKPRANGQTLLKLTFLEFLDKLALLTPLPRKHRHRYHGVWPERPITPSGDCLCRVALG